MRSLQSRVELAAYQQELVEALLSDECLVFLDTNSLAWHFRLNDVASSEIRRWLGRLADCDRLAIPAWTVHEYNQHLLRGDRSFLFPDKALGKQLNTNLTEFDRVVHLMTSDRFATELGYSNRDALLSAWSMASDAIQRCVAQLAAFGALRQQDVVDYLGQLISDCGLNSNVHELVAAAASETPARYANRLSPGYEDADKTENSIGDFIIWREVLGHCQSKGAKKAVLVTNDRKADWVYTPFTVVLPNGRSISGSNQMARQVKLPKPDLLAEFERHTGGTTLHVSSIESIIEVLSSAELNPVDAQDFRHLALAIKLAARTPTEAVVQWFLRNSAKYTEAVHGVCSWERCPSEVDQEEFQKWTVKEMKLDDPQRVNWTAVFCELFL